MIGSHYGWVNNQQNRTEQQNDRIELDRRTDSDRTDHNHTDRTESDRTDSDRTEHNHTDRTKPIHTDSTEHHRQNRIRQNRTQSLGQNRTIHMDSTKHHRQNRIGQNSRLGQNRIGQKSRLGQDRSQSHGQNRISNRTEQQTRTEQNTITYAWAECTTAHTQHDHTKSPARGGADLGTEKGRARAPCRRRSSTGEET